MRQAPADWHINESPMTIESPPPTHPPRIHPQSPSGFKAKWDQTLQGSSGLHRLNRGGGPVVYVSYHHPQ